MAKFHFKGQHMTNQQIAGSDIHDMGQSLTIGTIQSIQNTSDRTTQLSQLQLAVLQTTADSIIAQSIFLCNSLL